MSQDGRLCLGSENVNTKGGHGRDLDLLKFSHKMADLVWNLRTAAPKKVMVRIWINLKSLTLKMADYVRDQRTSTRKEVIVRIKIN